MKTTLNGNMQSLIKDSREKIINFIRDFLFDEGGTFYFQDERLNIFNTMQTEDGTLSQYKLKRIEIVNEDNVVIAYSNPNNPEKEITDFISLLSIQELISLMDSIQLCLQYKHTNLFSTNITIFIK